MQPICLTCQHFGGYDADDVWCMAYPNGIPDAIFGTSLDGRGMVDHLNEHQPGDHGLKYETNRAGGWDAAYLDEVRDTMLRWAILHPESDSQAG